MILTRASKASAVLSNHKSRAQVGSSIVETTCSHLYLSDKYKEENWNLEVTLQELRIQFSDSQSTVQRLEGEHKRLTRQFNKAREATDQHKNEAERLKNGLEELKANHETAIAQARRQTASLQRDKSDLQQSVDSMKAEIARLNRRLPRMGSPMTPEGRDRSDLLTPHDREISDVFSTAPSTSRRRGDTSAMFSADGEYDSSPDVSPSRPFHAPNHPSNEVEALQQRLAHAQRQINTLKSTLQREKELKIEYRKRLDASPNVSVSDLNTEEFVTDDDTEDGTPGTGKHPRRLGSFRVGRGGRGRGRGRGGITLIQRLEHAARGPPSDFEEDEEFGVITSTPPPPPALPVFFGGGAEADDEPEPDYRDEEPVAEPPSNRGSLDGLDPAFANVLRRSSSSGSLPYNRSPLRQAVVSRTLPRRSRGGAAFQEARPASLVGQPEALAAELFGTGMDSVAEAETVVETAEFGCQTELEVVASELPPPIQITPAAPENAEFGVQVDPEVPEPKVMVDTPTQTDPEPILRPEPKVVLERADTGVQHESIEVPRFYAESSIETDPIVEHQTIPIALPASLPDTLQAGVQGLSIQTTEATVQTLPVPVLEKVDIEVQTTLVPSSSAFAFDAGEDADGVLSDPITPPTLPHDSSGDTTIYGGILASELELGDGELDDTRTETGADTDTEADYQDARQSIVLTTPTPSMEDYQSMQTFSDGEDGEETDGAESIKVSMLSYRQGSESGGSVTPPPLEPVRIDAVRVTYDSQAVQAEPPEEPTPIPVSTSDPEPIPAPLPIPVAEPPKAELKEIAVQTDKWVSTPPASPVHPRGPSLLGPFKTASAGSHQFQYIAPHSPGPATTSTPTHSVPPSPSAVTSGVRDSVATIIPAPRSLTHDRRQSIESTLSGADDNTPRSRIPVAAPAPVDKSRPPMMILPPPPRAPPPPNSMPPPPFIPERRIPTSSTSSHDVAPGRPISPPPPELIQRATTPTFGSLRGNLPRQHGSSLPPTAQGLASRPSTHSFRSAANVASHVIPPNVISIFSRERDRVRGMSSTSLQSDRSLGSGRSSMSSDNHYYPARSQSRATNAPPTAGVLPQNGSANSAARGTDPAILHAITQTMIGEFLYKYTRRTIGKGHGERRHKRFFWVHPYTRTLYWSDADPGSSNVSESSAKSGECLLSLGVAFYRLTLLLV